MLEVRRWPARRRPPVLQYLGSGNGQVRSVQFAEWRSKLREAMNNLRLNRPIGGAAAFPSFFAMCEVAEDNSTELISLPIPCRLRPDQPLNQSGNLMLTKIRPIRSEPT